MKRLKATDINQIGGILDFVHDRTIQLDKLMFEQSNGVFTIPLTVISDQKVKEWRAFFVRTWRCPLIEAILRIKHASAVDVKDEAQIGEGAINTISTEDDCVVVKCSVPVEIRVHISALELELELTDTVVGETKRFALF
jgi:hypothetical protein